MTTTNKSTITLWWIHLTGRLLNLVRKLSLKYEYTLQSVFALTNLIFQLLDLTLVRDQFLSAAILWTWDMIMAQSFTPPTCRHWLKLHAFGFIIESAVLSRGTNTVLVHSNVNVVENFLRF